MVSSLATKSSHAVIEREFLIPAWASRHAKALELLQTLPESAYSGADVLLLHFVTAAWYGDPARRQLDVSRYFALSHFIEQVKRLLSAAVRILQSAPEVQLSSRVVPTGAILLGFVGAASALPPSPAARRCLPR